MVFVPVRMSSIKIDSAVYRPGIYESKNDESIKNMINYAGGIKPDASSMIEIKRILPMAKRMDSAIPIKQNYYFSFFESNKIFAQDGDTVIVRTIFDSRNEVEILGQVKKPGKYSYFKGMSLYDLLKISSGFEDESFMNSVSAKNAEIIRVDPNSSYEKIIKINLLNNISDNQNVILNNMDKIIIHENPNFSNNKAVEITGEIAVPGYYVISANNNTLKDLIEKAGGLTSKALTNGITINRDKELLNIDGEMLTSDKSRMRLAWTNTNIKLMPGDSIHVKKKSNTVLVTGDVNMSGLVEYRRGASLSYYLSSAGGTKSKQSTVNIIYPNGTVKTKNIFLNPRIYDGSTIVITADDDVERFNLTQFASNLAQIISFNDYCLSTYSTNFRVLVL